MQYSRVATNAVITTRICKFQGRWTSMATSPAPYSQKILALKTVAWPNTLHGIASAHLGDKHLDTLRTSAMQSLKESKPGTSPSVHLSLCENPMSDPGCYALVHTVCQFRQGVSPDHAIPIFNQLALSPVRVKPQVGPCSVLLHRLRQVFWCWDLKGYLVDQCNVSIDLWECPIQELRIRLVEAWQRQVALTTSARKTFDGMQNVNVPLSTENLLSCPKDRALLLTAMNGTFYTADHLQKRDPTVPPACHLCGDTDNVFHRNWECPALAEARSQLSSQDREKLLEMPPATKHHGWIMTPPSLLAFRKKLELVTTQPEHVLFVTSLPQHIHYFTDGACRNPQDSQTRWCAWGVCCVLPGEWWTFHPVASGVLQGRSQSIVRAELTAVLEALINAWYVQCQFTLWIDNQGVVNNVLYMVQHPDHHWTGRTKNHDLLNLIAMLVRHLGSKLLAVHKVTSHQQHVKAEDAAELWAFSGNDAADALASEAFSQDPEMHKLWENVCTDIAQLRHLRDQLHLLFVQIGNLSIRKLASQTPDVQLVVHRPPRELMQPWDFPDPLPPQARSFAIPEIQSILQWVQSLQVGEGDVVRWSWWELYVDANLQLEGCGPWYNVTKKQWQGFETQPADPFLKRARSFSQFFTKLAKCLSLDLPTRLACPVSCHLSFWTNTLPVIASTERIKKVDEWLGQWISGAGKTCDLRVIP